jgi:hypothetical protein
MTVIDSVYQAYNDLEVSAGVVDLTHRNSRTDYAAGLCDFCLIACQQCGMGFLSHEGLIACELDDKGFLTGIEIALCPTCYSIEKMDAKHEHDGNTKWRPCLSNTTNSFKNDAFGRFDSESEELSE